MKLVGGSLKPAIRPIAIFARVTVASAWVRLDSVSSASTKAESSIALATARPPHCKSIPSKKNHSITFFPALEFFPWALPDATWAAFFCQNWDISKSRRDQVNSTAISPEDVVLLAIENGCPSIAFTYNEPTIWGEYVIDICAAAKQYGLNTVMVSNGYITYAAFHDIYDHVDAANIDLKAFTENFYGKITLTHLQPVLETLQWLKNETNVWFEVTNLMIPSLNDDPSETRKLAEWMLEHLGPDVPLHFTAFHPDFKLQDKPRTPPETLHRARQIAREVGLHYVYEGNIFSDAANTCCPGCGALLISRSWHNVREMRLVNDACPSCRRQIPGRWKNPHAQAIQEGTPQEILRRSHHAAKKHAALNL